MGEDGGEMGAGERVDFHPKDEKTLAAPGAIRIFRPPRAKNPG
jgi:hypothetical protein